MLSGGTATTLPPTLQLQGTSVTIHLRDVALRSAAEGHGILISLWQGVHEHRYKWSFFIDLHRCKKMVYHAVPHTVGSAPHAPSPARLEALPPARPERAPSAPGRSRSACSSAVPIAPPPAVLHDQPASAAPCAWPSSRYRFGSPVAARPAPRPDPDEGKGHAGTGDRHR